MLKVCDFEFHFDKEDRIYEVGERVTGNVQLIPRRQLKSKGLKLNIFWRTHGRGNRRGGGTMALEHDFNERALEPDQTYSLSFSFDAPPGPLTYRGHHLNVDWYLHATLDAPLRPGFLDPKDETEFLLLPREGVTIDLGPAYEAPAPVETLDSHRIRWNFVAFGGIFVGASLLWLLSILSSTGRGASVFLFLFALVFLFVGLFFVYGGVRNRLAQRRLGEVEVSFDTRELVPGETLTCRVRFRPEKTLELERLRFKLEAKERVVSGSGTNESTHRHTLFEEERVPLSGQTLEAGQDVALTESFTLPIDAPYSFAAKDNEVRWELNVLVDTKGLLDWSHDYPLAVVPWRETDSS